MKHLSETILGTVLTASACATPQRPCPEVPQPAPAVTPCPTAQPSEADRERARHFECYDGALEVVSGAFVTFQIGDVLTPGMEERDCRIIGSNLTRAERSNASLEQRMLCIGDGIRPVLRDMLQRARRKFEGACPGFVANYPLQGEPFNSRPR